MKHNTKIKTCKQNNDNNIYSVNKNLKKRPSDMIIITSEFNVGVVLIGQSHSR